MFFDAKLLGFVRILFLPVDICLL